LALGDRLAPGRPKAGSSFSTTKGGRFFIGAAALILLILLWEAAAKAVGADIILPKPGSVLGEALTLYPTSRFFAALIATFFRGLSAFGISLLLGGVAGLACGLFPAFDAALAPLLTIIRATPVLALILVALLWFPSGAVPIFAAVLMSFPIMVTSAAAGARAADGRLVEMARLFRVPRREELLRLRLPAAAPFLISGARSALGLSWKVVVAGEVLAQPIRALGSGMQDARVMLETPRVFAWAAASIFLCGVTEWIFGLATKAALKHGL
jgi:NitT/TauT family transport system permease protein